MAEKCPKLGGYECSFTEPIPDDLICLICTLVARDPQQLTCCGKLFCTNCLEELGEDKPCPNCRKEGWKSFPDKKSTRNILALKIKCSNSSKGCIWTGELREQDDHMKVCEYELIKCENECYDSDKEICKVLRKDLKKHLREECSRRLVECNLCEERGEYSYITGDHYYYCPKETVLCDNEGCSEWLYQYEIQDESHEAECRYAWVECTFAEFGCTEKVQRIDLYDHEKEAYSHLRIAFETIQTLKKEHEEANQLLKINQAKLLDAVRYIDQHLQGIQSDDTRLQASKQPPQLSSVFNQSQSLVVATFKIKNYKLLSSFKSLPFYTSPGGYKMNVCIRLTDTHLSIHVNIVPGENDTNLNWPCKNAKIEIQLLNQKSDKDHISKLIVFKNKKHKLRKYESEGDAKAIPREKITNKYSLEETLYFRVTVHEIQATSKPWLICTE